MASRTPYFSVHLNRVLDRLVEWKTLLPNVRPLYAVKCNPSVGVLRTLQEAGAGFDCASAAEVRACLSPLVGAAPSDLVYANPVKQVAHLRAAKKLGVNLTTFDSAEELASIARHHPRSRLLLRLLVDDSASTCKLGVKFGAPLESVPGLVREARRLNLGLAGVSFHVGSGATSARAFGDAVVLARRAADMVADAGFPVALLDIGGGFPAHRHSHADLASFPTRHGGFVQAAAGNPLGFPDVCEVLRRALGTHFPRTDVIAEPGRFLVADSHLLHVSVVNVKVSRCPQTGRVHEQRVYMDDGLYGSFNCIVHDHASVSVEVDGVRAAAYEGPLVPTTLFGPTCDGHDCVATDALLPPLLAGQRLTFHNMGAYTLCAASKFNGFPIPAVRYV